MAGERIMTEAKFKDLLEKLDDELDKYRFQSSQGRTKTAGTTLYRRVAQILDDYRDCATMD